MQVTEMVKYIQKSYANMINQSTWLDENTKKSALRKLKNMKSNIGYHNILDTPENLEKLYDNVTLTNSMIFFTR